VGVPSAAVSVGKHGFEYPETGVVVDHPLDLGPFVRSADIIVFMHSSFVDLGDLYEGRRLFVMHGGTAYRQYYKDLNRKRMSECDIYIDGVCPMQGKERYGEWGVQTLEAMALGKLAMAHGTKPGPWLVNTEEDLRVMLRMFLMLSDEAKSDCRRAMRKVVENGHSYPVIGKQLKEDILEL